MPTYSFGEDSPLKFEIPDKLAVRYNEAVEKYMKAQRRFLQKHGRRWDPLNDPIELRWTRKQQWAWNKFAQILENAVENDGRYHPNDIMDDFLVKNTVSAVASGVETWKSVIGVAAACGALYGFFVAS